MIKRLMILSLLLVSMISKSWAYSFINGFCEYEVLSEDEQTVRLICFVAPNNMSSDTDIALSRFVTDESTNITYQLTEIKNTYGYAPNPKLGTLTIPVSVKKIEGISSIEFSSLIVVEGNPVYDSRNNCNAIIETATNKLLHGCKNTVIPSSVTSIGDNAFSYCSGFTSISIPSSVTSIGDHAFSGCSGLTGISIPCSVTSIGDYAFNSCSGLTTITVDADNPVYDSRNNCNAIIETATNELISGCKNTVIPSSVTSIGGGAFSGCSSLTSISIPSSVTSIGDQAFSGCSGLTTITVEAGNPVYDSRNNCNAIIKTATNELIIGCKNTVIPSSVTSIGDYAFTGCSGLTSISIPSSVTSIGDQAFDGCSSLTNISIPNSVTSIGDQAFYYCVALTSVTCKSSTPPSLGENVFSGTPTSTLYVPAGSKAAYEAASVWNEFKEIIEIENITFADSKVKEICVANWDANKDGELSYAEAAAVTSIDQVFDRNEEITSFNELQYFTGLTSIGNQAFYGCTCLTSVSIPSSVTSIGSASLLFFACSSLTTITVDAGNPVYDSRNNCNAIIETATNELITGCKNTVIPSSVTSIDNFAFCGCTGLTGIVIPGSVTSIGGYAFSDCSDLTSVSIPSSMTSIGGGAFSGCSSLTSIVIPGSVTSIGGFALSGCSGLTTITVDADNPVYDSRNNCNAIIETATNELISGCKNTVIPSSVTSIGVSAFDGCSGLTSVSIPSSVTSIGSSAFSGCSGLTGISIPSSVTSIGDYAFFGCSGLTTITVEAGNPVYDSRNNCNAIIETATNELISGCNNTVIPSSVTSIGNCAFYGCTGLTGISIPGSVTSIGDHAFSGCSGLTGISIPSSVTSIGNYAFYGCFGLTSVTCKSSTPPSLGENVFFGTPTSTLYVPAGSKAAYAAASVWNEFKEIIEIEDITFADSKVKEICVAKWDVNKDGELSYAEAAAVTSIDRVFNGNEEITSFNELQYFTGLTSIDGHAFDGCTCLTSVSIPSSVTSIGELAFDRCTGLTGIVIPGSLTSIGYGAFSGCSGLTTITVEAGNPVYDSRNNCNAIIETATNELIFGCKNTDIPSSVTSIGANAFYGCTRLTSIVIPSSVTSIGGLAFYRCSGLTGIVIPGSVTSIDNSAFSDCSGLTTITVKASNPVYDSRNNCNAIIETATNELISGCKNTVIPSSVTSIGDFAFSGCFDLTSVSIPSSVTSIGYSAFRNCSGLTSIVIPGSVTSIGAIAFSYCSGLTGVTCKSSTPPSLGESVFSGTPTSTLYVPAGSKAAYEAASIWNEFKEIIEIENITFADSKVKEICVANWDVNKDGELNYDEAAAVTSIGQVFYGNSEITSFNELQYFTGLTSIGDQAFRYCYGLTSIVIPSSVTSIGSGAFYGCFGLTSISIPSSVTCIGNIAFSDCSGLTSIVIPGSVTSIDGYAFSGCSGLTTITVEAGNPVYDSRNNCNAIIETATNELISGCKNTVIPSSVTSIGRGAFSGCSGLTSVSIPSSVTSIGYSAFSDCSGLTSIVIPSSVTSIGDLAFGYCSGLTNVTCKSSTPLSLGENVFFGTPTSTLYVPAGSKAAYEEASVWNDFKEIVPIATVTINKYGSGTYCSPYALDFTNVSGMKAYVAAGYNTTTNTVYMLSVKTAQPGEGLFIKGAPGDYTVPEIETSSDNYLNLLVGTTNEVTVNALSDDGKYTNYAYSLNKGTDVPAFYKYSDGSKCMAYKAYLQIPTSWLPTVSEAKTVKLVFDDEEPTGIEEFRTEKDVDDVKIYDMQGRRVAKPGKGLYIVNGKKVVFK